MQVHKTVRCCFILLVQHDMYKQIKKGDTSHTYHAIAITLQVLSSEAKRNKYISPKKPYTQ